MAMFMFLEVSELTSTGRAYQYVAQVSDIIQIYEILFGTR